MEILLRPSVALPTAPAFPVQKHQWSNLNSHSKNIFTISEISDQTDVSAQQRSSPCGDLGKRAQTLQIVTSRFIELCLNGYTTFVWNLNYVK